MKEAQLLRRIKLQRNVKDRELERLARIRAEKIKAEGYFIMLPLFLQNDLDMMEEERHRAEGKEFWRRIRCGFQLHIFSMGNVWVLARYVQFWG